MRFGGPHAKTNQLKKPETHLRPIRGRTRIHTDSRAMLSHGVVTGLARAVLSNQGLSWGWGASAVGHPSVTENAFWWTKNSPKKRIKERGVRNLIRGLRCLERRRGWSATVGAALSSEVVRRVCGVKNDRGRRKSLEELTTTLVVMKAPRMMKGS